MRKILMLLALIVGLIIIDQVSKNVIQSRFHHGESIEVIKGFFSITYVRNPGAAFGFMANADDTVRKPLFLLIPIIACVWLVALIWRTREKNKILFLSYGLILAGAVGNLIDRFLLGYVVDFVDFYVADHHFPAFNVADSAITIAAVLLIYDFLLEIRRKKDQKVEVKPLEHSANENKS
ncbi:MAG: signal peptidase II [Bdellovibrionales bacterium GWA2_49_15]|nr:MAG: signal peptidase II [Bdellovibrionales bacterium GWA2_49_15]